jgi:glucuronate isomerase
MYDRLARDLYLEICRIPLIDPHSHINPHQPTAKTLDDILGYHYYTELAHSAGMDQEPLAESTPPRARVRAILEHLDRLDNTVQYSWFLEIVRTFLGYKKERLSAADCDWLFDAADQTFQQAGWEDEVLRRSNVEMIFLTNDFDDTLDGFDTRRYVPCLRTDDLVFHLDEPEVRRRLADCTNIDVGDADSLKQAVRMLFELFKAKGARACAISLPPSFAPSAVRDEELSRAIAGVRADAGDVACAGAVSRGVFWRLAEHCREFDLPFDLMIGVNRRVYRSGVHQGQDLFDQRTSLIQYAELFNSFPSVTFPISVLTSVQNQELVSYSWIFPNLVASGHWWYSNIPAYIEHDLRARLQAVPKTKQIGYYSDAYKLEFVLPKFNMYRRILAQALADDFVRPGRYSEKEALETARLLLRGNAERIFLQR